MFSTDTQYGGRQTGTTTPIRRTAVWGAGASPQSCVPKWGHSLETLAPSQHYRIGRVLNWSPIVLRDANLCRLDRRWFSLRAGPTRPLCSAGLRACWNSFPGISVQTLVDCGWWLLRPHDYYVIIIKTIHCVVFGTSKKHKYCKFLDISMLPLMCKSMKKISDL